MRRWALLTLVAAALAAATAAPAPKIEPIDREGYALLLGSLKGQVVVVNMWATWCEPCREEFPDLVKLHRELSGRGVRVVAVSLDQASALEKEVAPFLQAQGTPFATYIKSPGGDDEFINAVDPSWSGALPATFVYDRTGRLARGIHGRTSLEELRGTALPLLR